MRFRFSVAGNASAGRALATRLELCSTAAEAVAAARRFRAEGCPKVQVADMRTNEPCDEAGLERAAVAEGD